MPVTLELPEAVLRQVEGLAERRGLTVGELIRQLVDAHMENNHPSLRNAKEIRLPLIPASETGPIGPFDGAYIDQLFLDHFPSGR
jgi:hypothetical protein